jgi:hypothetical protein
MFSLVDTLKEAFGSLGVNFWAGTRVQKKGLRSKVIEWGGYLSPYFLAPLSPLHSTCPDSYRGAQKGQMVPKGRRIKAGSGPPARSFNRRHNKFPLTCLTFVT